MALITLNKKMCRERIQIDTGKPGMDGIVGLDDIVSREEQMLRARFPDIGSWPDEDKARVINRWLTPSVESPRCFSFDHTVVAAPYRYHCERVIDTNPINPEINCFGFGIIGTLLARRFGMDANVELISVIDTGDQTTHACDTIYVNGKAVLGDPSYGMFGMERAFGAKHRLHKPLGDKNVFFTLLAYHFDYEQDFIGSIRAYEKAVHVNPDHPDLLYALSINRFYQGMERESLRLAKKSLKEFPDCTWALSHAGDVCHWLGEITQSRSHYRKQARAFYRRAFELGNIIWEAELDGEDVILRHGTDLEGIRAGIELADMLIEEKKYKEAIGLVGRCLTAASKIENDITQLDKQGWGSKKLETHAAYVHHLIYAHFELGFAYEKLGDKASSEKHYQTVDELAQLGKFAMEEAAYRYAMKGKLKEALLLGPTLARTLFLIATELAEQGDTAEAEQFYTASLKQDRFDIDALNNYACLLIEDGRAKEAMPILKRLLEVNPDDPDALYNLANVNGAYKRRAIAVLEKKQPMDPGIKGSLAALYAASGRVDEAIAFDSNDPEALYEIGYHYYRQDDLENAAVYLRKALRKDPKDRPTRELLAAAYAEAGLFEKAKRLGPKDAEVLFLIGNCYFDQEQWKKAIAKYERVLEIKPGDRTTIDNLREAYVEAGFVEKAERLGI